MSLVSRHLRVQSWRLYIGLRHLDVASLRFSTNPSSFISLIRIIQEQLFPFLVLHFIPVLLCLFSAKVFPASIRVSKSPRLSKRLRHPTAKLLLWLYASII